MDNQKALEIILEKVLGTSYITGKNNRAYKCPFCNHMKNKLEVQMVTSDKNENPWHCWVCNHKGKTLFSLFKKLKVHKKFVGELELIVEPSGHPTESHDNDQIELPAEYTPITNSKKLDNRKAYNYLRKRGVNPLDIINYEIGYCDRGDYEGRVIIPSFDEHGMLNYFIARDYTNVQFPYINPSKDVSRIIGWEYYINWNDPVIIVEGVFDALTIKRNTIPLFGKVIHDTLLKKLLSANTNRVYIALDEDARKDAIKQCEKLLSYGIEVYFVEINEGDINKMGFEKFLEILEQTPPLNFKRIMDLKLRK
jgi:transcription elongation factor Elf1